MKSQMTIGRKILLLASGLLALCGIMGTVSLISLHSIDASILSLTGDAMPGLEQMGGLIADVYGYRGDAWKHMASSNDQQMETIESEMTALKAGFNQTMADYEKCIYTDDDRANFGQLRVVVDRYFQAWEMARTLSRAHKNEEAIIQYAAVADPPFQEAKNKLLAMKKWNSDYAIRTAAAANQAAASARFGTWVVLLGSFAFGGVLAWFLIRGLNSALRQAVAELSESAAQVSSAASQVAASSQSLAQGASEQAASLEETSASSEEINSMAHKNTEHSNETAGLVAQTQQKFGDANRSLDQMVVAMGDINTQSGKIAKIIKVIDEIAFQTNILALNAAVEAARAGEAGMGFAVVADEVRNLAQRSAQAARDTTTMIEESITKSNDGKTKVDDLATVIRAITEESKKIKNLVDGVSQGSQEQARGIEQVSKAVVQMEQVTQKNAASAEESAAAAEELNAQSDTLREVVERLTQMVNG